MPPIGAVAAVVMVIALLLALNSNPQRDNAGPALTSPTVAPPAPTESSAPPSARPTATHSAVPTRVEAKRTSRPSPAVLPVSVLNNSTRSGLAHRVAAQVAAQGWPIAKVGNFTGRVRVSTLYYAPGQFESAQRLAASMPAIQRVLPRFSGLPTPGLTLVVTREWPA